MTQQIISGIYKITNTITNEFYIGASSNIYRRWQAHKNRYKNILSKEYNKKLYSSMRHYGINSFKFEILEECPVDNLFKREQFFIESLNAYELGYNENHEGENHGKSKVTVLDVIDIRQRYANHETKRNVYLDYCDKIKETGFNKIWNGYTWQNIMQEVYTIENKQFHKNNTGSPLEDNAKTKLKNKDVLFIREQKDLGSDKKEVYKMFQDKLTFGSFSNIWYGYNWKSLT